MNVSRRRYMGVGGGEKPFEEQYLTFEALEDGTFTLGVSVDYSIDNGATWTTLTANTATPTIHAGEKILWRKSGTSINKTFSATGNFNVYGNVMSLLYGDNFVGEVTISATNTFRNLFSNNTHVVSAENLVLPATTLKTSSYANMFSGCTSLTTAPKELPNATLGSGCCSGMFFGCTSLTTAPILKPATLASNCYAQMFRSCSKLNHIEIHATNISASSCLFVWLDGTKTSGTATIKSGVTYPRTSSGIPSGWTITEIS